MVELVDTLDLGSSAARRGGSTPFIRTSFLKESLWLHSYKLMKNKERNKIKFLKLSASSQVFNATLFCAVPNPLGCVNL